MYKLPILWKKFATLALKIVRELGLEIKMGRMGLQFNNDDGQ